MGLGLFNRTHKYVDTADTIKPIIFIAKNLSNRSKKEAKAFNLTYISKPNIYNNVVNEQCKGVIQSYHWNTIGETHFFGIGTIESKPAFQFRAA